MVSKRVLTLNTNMCRKVACRVAFRCISVKCTHSTGNHANTPRWLSTCWLRRDHFLEVLLECYHLNFYRNLRKGQIVILLPKTNIMSGEHEHHSHHEAEQNEIGGPVVFAIMVFALVVTIIYFLA
jgi:hypothetical protein